ncbi:hypothetical protein GCM10011391_08940 [Pullulanibacillus camelliae]|uniref:Uncharacterized protein n=1 Tax=Pullulanibacillus camelliae TaxID=1707096 RepID=A0A8J2VMW4_9BACL|nr:hypothetical protein [Pullulanibacillus camelliae]GGE32467.1 hypothetical protein GCM10011391_08940 [Pullulanibacillus camelliae]
MSRKGTMNDLVEGANTNSRKQHQGQADPGSSRISNSGNSYVFVEATASARALAEALAQYFPFNSGNVNSVSPESDTNDNNDCDYEWDDPC